MILVEDLAVKCKKKKLFFIDNTMTLQLSKYYKIGCDISQKRLEISNKGMHDKKMSTVTTFLSLQRVKKLAATTHWQEALHS